ncbi:polysaccharide pyruvyl transferase family protein [Intrasporangium calvum]|uniref:polysaccharide pyruvyl transferase family protein n=1 Tax=Intrasporangium calvum TaxID=53358 RepID=UPI000DF628EB|nr:polysaccharide pyruvyl transferase family protein [Intrasporangium calvum]AXG12798.1 polysaccharide pyruvyl transferase family protein [Intrasporangium calvum]
MTIGVMGCVRELPAEFPISFAENAGNMIHGNAPFEMFGDAVHSSDKAAIRATGSSGFAEFVNKHCSHLIVTLANTLRLNDTDGTRYSRLLSTLEKIDKPVVIFGLGVQSASDDISEATLPSEAVRLMKHLGERAPLVGVRGQTTADVLAQLCGVNNTFVTGCPSLYSRPQALARLGESWQHTSGRPAFNGTKLHQPSERSALHRAIRHGHFIVETVNKFNHQYHVDVSRGLLEAELPYFLRNYTVDNPDRRGMDEVAAAFRQNYRLFRDTKSWYTFNSACVSFSYGTRFHANMASVLSGRPALWVTHDSRTRELTKALHLPALSQQDFDALDPREIGDAIDYTDFFDHIGALFAKFNEYLSAHGLPKVSAP